MVSYLIVRTWPLWTGLVLLPITKLSLPDTKIIYEPSAGLQSKPFARTKFYFIQALLLCIGSELYHGSLPLDGITRPPDEPTGSHRHTKFSAKGFWLYCVWQVISDCIYQAVSSSWMINIKRMDTRQTTFIFAKFDASLNESWIELLGIGNQLKDCISAKKARQIYHSCVQSPINRGIKVYGSCEKTSLEKVQILQNKLLNLVLRLHPLTNTNALHNKMKILVIKDVYELTLDVFVHCNLPGYCPLQRRMWNVNFRCTQWRKFHLNCGGSFHFMCMIIVIEILSHGWVKSSSNFSTLSKTSKWLSNVLYYSFFPHTFGFAIFQHRYRSWQLRWVNTCYFHSGHPRMH